MSKTITKKNHIKENQPFPKIRTLLRLRKQNDGVKIALAFLVIGIFLCGMVLYRGISLYFAIQTETEYTVSCDGQISNDKLSAILELDSVESASRSVEESVTFKNGSPATSIDCALVAKEYIEKLYGTEIAQNEKTFYANKKAFEAINQELNLKEYSAVRLDSGKEARKYSIQYLPADSALGLDFTSYGSDSASGQTLASCKTAALIVADDAFHGEAFLCTFDSSSRLASEATSLRIAVQKKDFDGTLEAELLNLGFSFADPLALTKESHETELSFLHIKYGAALAAVCLAAGALFLSGFRP